jgi:hypothetical protein
MIINNDIKELILEYMSRYFKFENDFYKLPGISSKMEILPSKKWGQHE